MCLCDWDADSSHLKSTSQLPVLAELPRTPVGILKRALWRVSVLWLVSFVLVLPNVLPAQSQSEVKVVAPTLTTPATAAVTGVLADKVFDKLMRSGFPVRVHVKAELWRSRRFFDEIVAETEWDFYVRFDTFDGDYEVVRIVGDSIMSLGAFSKLIDAQRASELPYRLSLPTPPRGRESYINVQADVQTIEMSDLDELMGWLRGEARPAVEGKKNPTTVVGGALRSIGSRLLGAEVRHLEGRTKSFKL